MYRCTAMFCAYGEFLSNHRSTMELPYRPMSSEHVSPQEEKEKPWKYIGYKVFSRWIASDPSFLIFRKFGALNARVALSLQDEIVQLEERLDHMDRIYSDRDTPDAHNGTIRDDPFRSDGDDRHALVTEILPEKLSRYNSFLNSYSQIVSRGPCRADDAYNVRRWLTVIRPTAISPPESEYIEYAHDLIQLYPQQRFVGRSLLESLAFGGPWFPTGVPGLRRWLSKKDPGGSVPLHNEGTVWPNDERVQKAAFFTISVLALGMLIGPLWALAYLQSTTDRLGVISGFIVLFFVVLVNTSARLFEALAATAAYAAVLVVFLQVGTGEITPDII
ncbi:hypothetical protein HBI46_188320 [Parastagonospora nodorum]|nr:hypothetical protein HBI46_188320 [Parastagonospora nodorum]